MKSRELSNLLNLPPSTLFKYSRDYEEYLSAPIVRGTGRHSEYTDRDIRILKLIVTMKTERVKPGDIDATLSSLRDGNWDRLPPLDEASKSIIPTQDNMIAAQVDKSALQREIEVLREMLATAEDRADRRVAAATADRDDILRRLAEAEQLVRLYESGRLKPDA